LNKPGKTVTPIPYTFDAINHNRAKYFPSGTEINGFYRSCIDIPVGKEHFSFACLDSQPSLVSSAEFIPGDGKSDQLNSIVQVQAACQEKNLWEKESHMLSGASCGQPYALDIKPAPSALTASFPAGRPAGIDSIASLLNNYAMRSALMDASNPIGNDYPTDSSCQLQPLSTQPCASAVAMICFHDWLRSNYAVPKIDSILAALNLNFNSIGQTIASSFVMEVAADGTVIIAPMRQNPFLGATVHENQLYAMSTEPEDFGNSTWMVMCRDEVNHLGRSAGGRHAGQLLPGNPVNWDELTYYVDPAFIQAASTRKPSGIKLSGRPGPGGGIAFAGAQLELEHVRDRPCRLRTSDCAASLAAEINFQPPSVIRYWHH
jgi:hypothetical protein